MEFATLSFVLLVLIAAIILTSAEFYIRALQSKIGELEQINRNLSQARADEHSALSRTWGINYDPVDLTFKDRDGRVAYI